MSYKVDLHTHSAASRDGALKAAQYKRMLDRKALDCIAITDHNTVDRAKQIQAELGADRIIIGEEITTTEGEIIGLYLRRAVPAGLTPTQAIQAIHDQGGLVYVPHPFETVRKGISLETFADIAHDADIIEVYNGRAVFQNRISQTLMCSIAYNIPAAASSDAHGVAGWGKTYSVLDAMPTRETLVSLLHDADYRRGFPGVRGVMYPKLNRMRKWGRHA